MAHEPYLGFGEGVFRWTAAASVHRVMTMILARAVSLVSVDDAHALTVEALRLLADDGARRDLGARGRDVYRQHFDLRHTIGALRRAAQEPCGSPS